MAISNYLTSSNVCAGLASAAFLVGAQARLTAVFTPSAHEEQKRKTVESQSIIYRNLGITPDTTNRVIGIAGLLICPALLYPKTRFSTACFAVGLLCLGARGRWISNRSVLPPMIVIALLIGAVRA